MNCLIRLAIWMSEIIHSLSTSCAAYDFARLVSLMEVDEKIAKGQLKLREPVSDFVLKRLQVGFVLSDETSPWIFQAGNGQALMIHLRHKGFIT